MPDEHSGSHRQEVTITADYHLQLRKHLRSIKNVYAHQHRAEGINQCNSLLSGGMKAHGTRGVPLSGPLGLVGGLKAHNQAHRMVGISPPTGVFHETPSLSR